jgi:hypothetical protein
MRSTLLAACTGQAAAGQLQQPTASAGARPGLHSVAILVRASLQPPHQPMLGMLAHAFVSECCKAEVAAAYPRPPVFLQHVSFRVVQLVKAMVPATPPLLIQNAHLLASGVRCTRQVTSRQGCTQKQAQSSMHAGEPGYTIVHSMHTTCYLYLLYLLQCVLKLGRCSACREFDWHSVQESEVTTSICRARGSSTWRRLRHSVA